MSQDVAIDLAECLAVFAAAADESGKVILPFFRGEFSVDHKQGKGLFDPVTEADRAAEKAIRDIIFKHYPTHGFIGEEFGTIPGQSRYGWIVDPIDGTRAFISGSPLWGSLIGLTEDGKPLMGMMNQPFTGERFYGGPEGAFFQRGDERRMLEVRQDISLDEALIMTTCPDLFANEDDLARFHALRGKCRMTRYGGDCYSYCLLAMGSVDLVVESGLAPYDIAPLIPIIKGAGGVITSWEGDEAFDGGRIIAAGSAAVHEAAMAILTG